MTSMQGTTATVLQTQSKDEAISLSCWQCGAQLDSTASRPANESGIYSCGRCDAVTERRNGIWIALPPHRAKHFDRFVTDYEFIREAEGRGSHDDAYYLALPYKDLTGSNSAQWAIRARTFDHLKRHFVGPLAALLNRPLRILDLGAGNGWMSYRFAQLGHAPIALDLLTNDRDGLGAARHFTDELSPMFARVQAELDHLPFPDATFDLAIFNASFHYSENYKRTFAEAARCTRTGGSVVIADTPWYRSEDIGDLMVAEKHVGFAAKYGFPSNSLANLEYLTPMRLQLLRTSVNARWKVLKPFYGLRWALRPLRARLLNRRPPSQFRIYVAQVNR